MPFEGLFIMQRFVWMCVYIHIYIYIIYIHTHTHIYVLFVYSMRIGKKKTTYLFVCVWFYIHCSCGFKLSNFATNNIGIEKTENIKRKWSPVKTSSAWQKFMWVFSLCMCGWNLTTTGLAPLCPCCPLGLIDSNACWSQGLVWMGCVWIRGVLLEGK